MSELAARRCEWSHGYDLCRRLELKPGTVYPILMRLADRDLVETTWEVAAPPGRPARHLYRLSATGADYLAEHAPCEPTLARHAVAPAKATAAGSAAPA